MYRKRPYKSSPYIVANENKHSRPQRLYHWNVECFKLQTTLLTLLLYIPGYIMMHYYCRAGVLNYLSHIPSHNIFRSLPQFNTISPTIRCMYCLSASNRKLLIYDPFSRILHHNARGMTVSAKVKIG